MRITGQVARQLTEYLNEISGGRIGLCQLGADIGHGSRIIDGNKQLVWLGQARETCAYYLGQIDGFREVAGVTEDKWPAHVREAHAEIVMGGMSPKISRWYVDGMADGEYRAAESRPTVSALSHLCDEECGDERTRAMAERYRLTANRFADARLIRSYGVSGAPATVTVSGPERFRPGT